MSGDDEDPTHQLPTALAGFGEALGAMRQGMIDTGVPERVADRVLSEVAREFARSWSQPRYSLRRRSGE